ncbi:hypothetical protein QVD17_11958 [Tagetes erecta]|uniref:Uncharacterized protein n=1 Tax=Tagetes erecta TaxID=13708 RepID=A0AAD8KUD5_TARER|nr:hypothetical protein QVD17_11958 [Tagetes erecta]
MYALMEDKHPTGDHIKPVKHPTGDHIKPVKHPTGDHIKPVKHPTGDHIKPVKNPTGDHIKPVKTAEWVSYDQRAYDDDLLTNKDIMIVCHTNVTYGLMIKGAAWRELGVY